MLLDVHQQGLWGKSDEPILKVTGRPVGSVVGCGAHGAMNKERQVCARRRAGEAAGSLKLIRGASTGRGLLVRNLCSDA